MGRQKAYAGVCLQGVGEWMFMCVCVCGGGALTSDILYDGCKLEGTYSCLPTASLCSL